MRLEDGPQLPLTPMRKALVAAGVAMFVAQIAVAALLAPPTTGRDDADVVVLAALWGGSVVWSVITVLLLVRQADAPDVATASFIVTIAAFATFALSAANDVRGTADEVSMVDALFLGVTSGALTALLVWGVAQAVARLLRLPTTAVLHEPR
jgi:hypothetical protein